MDVVRIRNKQGGLSN